jgi:hypothetical protein
MRLTGRRDDHGAANAHPTLPSSGLTRTTNGGASQDTRASLSPRIDLRRRSVHLIELRHPDTASLDRRHEMETESANDGQARPSLERFTTGAQKP